MKATVQVSDRREAEALRVGLEDPAVRAFVVIVGVLKPLTSRTRARVMQYVTDKLDEDQEVKTVSVPHQGDGNPT